MSIAPNDLILSELENLVTHLGEWSKHLVLGGGVALVVYDRCMAKSSARPVGTTDMDFLIPRKPLVATNAESLPQILKAQGFTHRTKNSDQPPVESYVKDLKGTEIEVEFLTDDRSRNKGESVSVKKAQVVAQPLSYLEMSLASVTTAKLPKGAEIRIVRPEAWVFHKGLTFPRRMPSSVKRAKDLYGIWFALSMLGEFSESTWTSLKLLQAKQPSGWTVSFNTNLREWLDQATPRNWDELLAQDPEGRLTEAAFRGLVKKLTTD